MTVQSHYCRSLECFVNVDKELPADDRADSLLFPTSSLREYGTGNKFSKQVESMPLMAVGSPAMLPLIICFYREIRQEKTTHHQPATAQRSAGVLIKHLS